MAESVFEYLGKFFTKKVTEKYVNALEWYNTVFFTIHQYGKSEKKDKHLTGPYTTQ